MKVLVIPDIHLKPYIFYKAAELMRKGCADRAVCLMDIADDWKKETCMECYEQIYDSGIDFAKEFPETLWCYGNHDLSYVWEEPETGYSSIMRNLLCRKLHQLDEELGENNSIRYVHRIDNVLFCHGGVSRCFVEKIFRYRNVLSCQFAVKIAIAKIKCHGVLHAALNVPVARQIKCIERFLLKA